MQVDPQALQRAAILARVGRIIEGGYDIVDRLRKSLPAEHAQQMVPLLRWYLDLRSAWDETAGGDPYPSPRFDGIC